jgi:hypothetical protein
LVGTTPDSRVHSGGVEAREAGRLDTIWGNANEPEEPGGCIDGCAVTRGDGRRDRGEQYLDVRYQGQDDGQEWQPVHRGPDLLISPGDEPREPWLRQALHRSGALAWPGRHRRLLGGLAAVLVVVVVGVQYMVNRPPAPDPVVDVSVVGFDQGPYQGDSSQDFDAKGRVRAKLSYQVTARAEGDAVKAVGVVGPGLINPTSSISTAKFGLPKEGTLGATVDCSGSAWWSAKDADYRARVRRTDTHGRVTTYDAPLDQSNASWHNGIRGSCLRSFFEGLPEATGSAVPGKHVVKVTLTLTNPSRHNLWLLPATFADQTVTGAGSRVLWTALPAGGTASITSPLRAADCSGAVPRVPFAQNPEGVPGKDRGLPVYLSHTKLPADWQTAGAWARIDPASVAQMDRALATLCPHAR